MIVIESEVQASAKEYWQETFEHDFREMEPLLFIVLKKIMESGKNYDLIIGDDTSGRFPTLVLAKVLNTLNHRKGAKSAAVRFVGGGKHRSNDISRELKLVLKRRKKSPERVLLVTDFVESGETIKHFGKVLSEHGMQYDVSSLTTYFSENHLKHHGRIANDSTVYSGEQRLIPLSIYAQYPFQAGLHRGKSLKSRVIRGRTVTPLVRQAREEVNQLAGRLLDRLSDI